jgi:hypothetical protein
MGEFSVGYNSRELHNRVMGVLLPSGINSDDVKIGQVYNWGFNAHVLGYKFFFSYDAVEVMLRQLWFQAIKNLTTLPADLKSFLFKIYNNGIYDKFENRLLATTRNGIVIKRNFEIVHTVISEYMSDIDLMKDLLEFGCIAHSIDWNNGVYLASYSASTNGVDEDIITTHFLRRHKGIERISYQLRIKGFKIFTKKLEHPSWMGMFNTPHDLTHNITSGIYSTGLYARSLGAPKYDGINIFVESTGTIWYKSSKSWLPYDRDQIVSTEVNNEVQMYLNTHSVGENS